MFSQKGFTGISFPFRFDGRGGVAISSTSIVDFSHIKESIIQIVLTQVGERFMELEFGSEIHKHLFSMSNDETDISILKFQIKEAIEKFEDRVEVESIDVIHDNESVMGGTWVVDVSFLVKKYLKNDVLRIKLN